MLVGKSNVNLQELLAHTATAEAFIEYSDSLVPSEFRHVKAIIDNQRYLCCLLLRQSKSISWDKKKEILDCVLYDVHIVGYTNCVIEVGTLFALTNRENVNKYYRKVGGK